MDLTIRKELSFRNFADGLTQILASSFPSPEKQRIDKIEEFKSIVFKYEGLIKRICFSFSKSGSEYDDLRQDVLINIWNGLNSFREESEISTWIYRVAFNTCVSTTRKNKIRDSMKDSLFDHTDLSNIDSNDKRDNIEKLHYIISKLPLEQRVIILMWLDEKSYDEMAKVTGLPRNTLATKLRRIKEKIIKIGNSDI